MLKIFALVLGFVAYLQAEETAILYGQFDLEGAAMLIVRSRGSLCGSDKVFLNVTYQWEVIHSDDANADFTIKVSDFITRTATVTKSFTYTAGNNYTLDGTTYGTTTKAGKSGEYLVNFSDSDVADLPNIYITYDKTAITADSIKKINEILQSAEGLEGASIDVVNAQIIGSRIYVE